MEDTHSSDTTRKPRTTTYTLITEPAKTLTPIYNLISSAAKSIDMTMYEPDGYHCGQPARQGRG